MYEVFFNFTSHRFSSLYFIGSILFFAMDVLCRSTYWNRSPENFYRIFYLSKSRSDSLRARRFFEALIIVPAVYLALQQHPAARSIALMSLGRKRGSVLASAMQGNRYSRCQNAPRALIA